MSSNRRYQHTLRYMRDRWPIYAVLYGSLVLAMLFIGVGLALDWYSLIPFSLAFMLVVSYFLVAYVYLAYRINDAPGGTAAEILFDLAQGEPEHQIACIDLGLRATAMSIARHLTTGKVTVIDVYNPQSNTGATLRRARDRAPKPPPDPRLIWINGSTSLLPMPDRCVDSVYINQILSEFWIDEEREQLLGEIFRILVPEGRLLLAEPVRAHRSPLLTGILTYPLLTDKEWRSALADAGFEFQRGEIVRGLLFCARFDKPSPIVGKQMQLKLDYD